LLVTYFKRDTHYILNSIETSQGGTNPDPGSKIRVYCRDTVILYLAFIITKLSKIDLTIIEFPLRY